MPFDLTVQELKEPYCASKFDQMHVDIVDSEDSYFGKSEKGKFSKKIGNFRKISWVKCFLAILSRITLKYCTSIVFVVNYRSINYIRPYTVKRQLQTPVNVNVNVISRTALIRNRVSRRVCT